MSRTIPAAVTTAIAATVTKPGVLVEVAFPSPASPFRASSRGQVKWNGNVFVPYGIATQGLGSDGSQSTTSGTIAFADVANVLGTLLLTYGIADVVVSVWFFYGDPVAPNYDLALADVVPQFVGTGSDCTIDVTAGSVSISLVQSGGRFMYGPRSYITREAGFNFVPPPGTIVPWGGEQFVLEAE